MAESAKKTFILSPSQNLDDRDEIPLFRKKSLNSKKTYLSLSLALTLSHFLTFSHLSLTLTHFNLKKGGKGELFNVSLRSLSIRKATFSSLLRQASTKIWIGFSRFTFFASRKTFLSCHFSFEWLIVLSLQQESDKHWFLLVYILCGAIDVEIFVAFQARKNRWRKNVGCAFSRISRRQGRTNWWCKRGRNLKLCKFFFEFPSRSRGWKRKRLRIPNFKASFPPAVLI